MTIIKTYKEHFPALRLIGKRYTDKDRLNGSFGHKWGEWFQNGWFNELERLNPSDVYVGAMRMINGQFEYWIGIFFKEDTPVPQGFDYEDIESFDVATCWIYGKESELFGLEVHNSALAEAKKHGLIPKVDGWCFECYVCPRYTTPDKKGNVILDYCIVIEDE